MCHEHGHVAPNSGSGLKEDDSLYTLFTYATVLYVHYLILITSGNSHFFQIYNLFPYSDSGDYDYRIQERESCYYSEQSIERLKRSLDVYSLFKV